ncbi:MAG: hypothetical protein V4503_01630 [Gemmatimonadota bacterium]
MKRLLAGLSLVFVVTALTAARPRSGLPHFQLTLERTAKGWAAECDSGCSWKQLSVSCASDCAVLIDADGVSSSVVKARVSDKFGFIVRRSERGWNAESVSGTAWKEIGWGCPLDVCRARVDELGVSGAVVGRVKQ